MKRSALLLSSALIAALLLMGCPTDSPDPDPEPTPLFDADGYLDLSGLDGYSADDEGIVIDSISTENYAQIYVVTLADLDGVYDFTKVELVADVYNGDTLIDLGKVWSSRIQGKAGAADPASNNMGVLGQTLDFSDEHSTLNFYKKGDPVTKVIIKGIKFSN